MRRKATRRPRPSLEWPWPAGSGSMGRRGVGLIKQPMNSNHRLSLTASLALGAWLGFVPNLLSAEVEKNLDQTFTVSPGGKLVIEADRGAIELATGSENKVEVKVFRKANAATKAGAEEILAAHEVTFHQDGDQVTVKAKYTKGNSGWGWSSPKLQVRFQVTVPRQFNPNLKTAGGHIEVADLAGEVRIQTAGGHLKTGRVEGTVWAKTAGGHIEIGSATGAIEARTAGGHIAVKQAGSTLRAETSGGSIKVDKALGSLDAETAGGHIEVLEARGPVTAKTSGGSIDVGLTSTPEEDCLLETAGGHIELRVPDGISANVDAKTSAGQVTCDLPVTVQGETKRSSLQGKLGDGGKLLKLRTSAGAIRIKAR